MFAFPLTPYFDFPVPYMTGYYGYNLYNSTEKLLF